MANALLDDVLVLEEDKKEYLKPEKLMGHVKKFASNGRAAGSVTTENELYMWGNNSRGQLGNGTTENSHFRVKILMVHGSPRRNNEDILPDMPLEQIQEILEGVDADLIFCGHTHVPCGYQTNKKQTVVNVGSVGRPMTENPQSCYVVANFENGGFSIEHRFVDYDRETASSIMTMRNFDGCEALAQMILKPTRRHV